MTNQQLKAHCEDVIANPQDHAEMVLAMATALLPCLEAVPFAYADVKAVIRMLKGDTRFFTAFQEESKTKRVAMFTDPPVPELKPIELPEVCAWNLCELLAKSEVIEAIRSAGYEVKS